MIKELKHAGVPGMHWGVRNEETSSGASGVLNRPTSKHSSPAGRIIRGKQLIEKTNQRTPMTIFLLLNRNQDGVLRKKS
jgi:hypothetical protein